MPTLSDSDEWNTGKNIGMVTKISSVATQILVNQYSYADVVRMIKVREHSSSDDDEDSEGDATEDECDIRLEAKSADPLAQVLATCIESMETTVREGGDEISISPATSVAELFQKEGKELKPRLFVAFDFGSDNADCVGVSTVANYVESTDFLTKRFNSAYCRRNSIPDLSQYLLIDTITARKQPSGLMMLLNILTTAMKNKKDGICMVAVTRAGKQLGRNFGMSYHSYTEDGASRELHYMALIDFSLSHLNRKLRLGSANTKILTELCTRNGLTSATRGKIYPRCNM